ncbi:ferritin family protein [Thermotoga sp. KOL6]|uniref:ferritin-like domain-containing protein n=1 Tax=Thermotoga sp. KOL6 TaxID=126741 RepID=UPI000C764154|nr:ferritin family protein [Thermotoga sp. KOL6]PLV58056.1 ferritin [Thermotoga sp. KOL6]
MIGPKDLLNIALKIESTGYTYYKNLAERSEGEAKALFERLAEQERDHSRKFKEILDKYEQDLNPSDEVLGYLESLAEMSIFPKLENTPPDDLREAVRRAIEVEKDSIIFYSEILGYVPEKEPVQAIIEEEKKHLRDLLRLEI